MMRDPTVIVGAGATAVHFAATALELGRRVVMLDVGGVAPAPTAPNASLNELKRDLDDPVKYFLGAEYESLILPTETSEYYGFPPSKSYVFAPLPGYEIVSQGFQPLQSFAGGGLAQAWTGGSYPFNDGELAAFPFGWDAMGPVYGEVARRIGVSGVGDDDLGAFYPTHDSLLPPVALDDHSAQLLGEYGGKRERLTSRHGMFLGRARSASLSRAQGERPACSLCGRCLWGCPTKSFYTPSVTLEAMKSNARFEYVPGVLVDRFVYDSANRVTHVVTKRVSDGVEDRREVGALVLAAGTISSGRVFLESLARAGVRHELDGLMDNRQVMMPFVNMKRLGAQFDDRSYQYHQLAIGAPGERPFDYVHGLITTLTTGMIHPVMQNLPVGMRAATALFRDIHGALGLANINFADTRRPENRMALETSGGARRLLITYTPPADEAPRLRAMTERFRGFLAALNCVAPPNMTRMRPMGASVHYAGTIPMLADGGDFTSDRSGRVRPFDNLIVADGSTFPSLPAKNLTFTLMANATRVARENLA